MSGANGGRVPDGKAQEERKVFEQKYPDLQCADPHLMRGILESNVLAPMMEEQGRAALVEANQQ